jgi:hypothetical protein
MRLIMPHGIHTPYAIRLHDGWSITTRRDAARAVWRMHIVPHVATGIPRETHEHPDAAELAGLARVACAGQVPDVMVRALEGVR